MKKRVLLLGVAFIFSMAFNCFAQGVPAPKSDNEVEAKTIFSFKNEIALTDEQENKLKAFLYDEQVVLNAKNNKLKVLGTELGKMIDSKEDMQVIKGKLEEISKVQVEVSYGNIENSRKVEMMLSPEQLEKWRDIQKKFSAQPGA